MRGEPLTWQVFITPQPLIDPHQIHSVNFLGNGVSQTAEQNSRPFRIIEDHTTIASEVSVNHAATNRVYWRGFRAGGADSFNPFNAFRRLQDVGNFEDQWLRHI